MALGDAKSGRDVDPTLRPDSRLAFRRPGRHTHGAHRTQGIIFADVGHYPIVLGVPWLRYHDVQTDRRLHKISLDSLFCLKTCIEHGNLISRPGICRAILMHPTIFALHTTQFYDLTEKEDL